MPNIRIKDIPTTASATVNGDFFAVDSSASTRKLDAFNPTIGGVLTVNGTGTSIFAGNANTALHVGAAAPYQRAAIGATRRLNYGDVLFSRNLQGQAGTDAYTAIGTDTGSGYSGFEARYGGAARILVGDGATTANAVVTPTVALSATTSSVLVPLATPFSISTSITVPSGTVGVGAVGTGGSFFVNTPSASDVYGSGLAVDGSYPGGIGAQSVVNLKAFGVMSGGGYGSTLTFQTTLNGTFNEVMRINSGRNLLIGTTTDSSNGRLQLAAHTAISGGIGFGPNMALYLRSANSVRLESTTSGTLFEVHDGSRGYQFITSGGNDLVLQSTGNAANGLYLRAHSGPLVLQSNSTAALTLDTSQNATFAKDILLGTNGPSVPSTLSGRAPRQGLVFDGSGSAASFPAFTIGSGNFTASAVVNATNFGSVGRVFVRGLQFEVGIDAFGRVYSFNGTTILTSTNAIVAGKNSAVAYVKNGSTGTFYIDGVSAGTVTDNLTYVTALEVGGNNATSGWLGTIEAPLLYNRALSAAEVKALYENGVPAAEELGVAGSIAPSNTTLTTSAVAQNFAYDTFSSTTNSFSAVETGGQACEANFISGTTFLGKAPRGARFLVSFTATLTSGATPSVRLSTQAVAGTSSAIVNVVNGSNSIILQLIEPFTAETGTGAGRVTFATSSNTNYSISNLVVTRLGTVLAPDATQTGGGLTWYDTSGNGANITLPASGVSWNVPFNGRIQFGDGTGSLPSITFSGATNTGFSRNGSGHITISQGGNSVFTAYYFSGGVLGSAGGAYLQLAAAGAITLGASGSNQSVLLSPSGTGAAVVSAASQAASTEVGLLRIADASNSNRKLFFGIDNTVAPSGVSYIQSVLTGTTTLPLILNPNGGPTLFGTAVNSNNGRIQLADHTASTGGIGFGTDVNLYRSAADTLKTDDGFIIQRDINQEFFGFNVANANTGTSALVTASVSNGAYGAGFTMGGQNFANTSFLRGNRLTLTGPFDINYVSGQHFFWIGGGGAGTSTAGSQLVFSLGLGAKITHSPISFSTSSWLTNGAIAEFSGSTVTNNSTAASGTAASAVAYSFAVPSFAATNASVTTTNAATLYVAGNPTASTNQTFTNAWGIWNAGRTKLGGFVRIDDSSTSSSKDTGCLVVEGGIGVEENVNVGGFYGLVDGVTAPATGAGYARIYIDSADGDLKIKFSDGTVKTIVTDT